MIRCIRKFTLRKRQFVAGSPRFLWHYVSSRSLKSLCLALPGILFSGLVLAAFFQVNAIERRGELEKRYTDLTEQALQRSDMASAELYQARRLEMTDDTNAASFDFAKRLYAASDVRQISTAFPLRENGVVNTEEFPLAGRALVLLQSIAPRRPHADGYPPAHRFLANYWKTRKPQTDVRRVLTMQHEMYAAPKDPVPAIKLAEFIAERDYPQQAIETLNPHRNNNADVLLMLARLYSKTGQTNAVNDCLKSAGELLQTQLQQRPSDTELRMKLSRCVATQGRILESLFVLVEGCAVAHSDKLVDSIIHRYSVWLSLMPSDRANAQLQEIGLALKFSSHAISRPLAPTETEELTLSDGGRVSLPAAIVEFHHALMDGRESYLIPLLLGTERVAKQDLEAAVTFLEQAYAAAPEHPVVANNLAWTLSRIAEAETQAASSKENDLMTDDKPNTSETLRASADSAHLERAWMLSNLAVNACPDLPAFRETRGTIAAQTHRWQQASEDLQRCASAGYRPEQVSSLLTHVAGHLHNSADTHP